MTCPVNGDCYVECREQHGCHQTTIDAQSQDGNFELLCEDNSNDIIDDKINICGQIQVLGSTLPSNTGTSFLVTCGADRFTCRGGVINCAQDMNCQVNCHQIDTTHGAKAACRGLDINGPTNYNLTVQCGDQNACQTAIINAEKSSLLHLACTDTDACCDTSIYCPVNTNQNDLCQIAGIRYTYT